MSEASEAVARWAEGVAAGLTGDDLQRLQDRAALAVLNAARAEADETTFDALERGRLTREVLQRYVAELEPSGLRSQLEQFDSEVADILDQAARGTLPTRAPRLPVQELLWGAIKRFIGPQDSTCEHLTAGGEAYWCLCCDDRAPRCHDCHHAHLPATCPGCGRALDPETRQIIHQVHEGGDLDVRPAAQPVAAKVIHGEVCVTCAIEDDIGMFGRDA